MGATHSTQPMIRIIALASASNKLANMRRCAVGRRAAANANISEKTTSGRTSPFEAEANTFEGTTPVKKSVMLGIGPLVAVGSTAATPARSAWAAFADSGKIRVR